MKKTRGLTYLLGILLFGLAGGSLVQAAEIEITADFRPAVTDKNHNTDRNVFGYRRRKRGAVSGGDR